MPASMLQWAVARTFLISQRAGFGSQLRRDRTLWFIGPDGARSACTPAGWLPAPLHLVPLLFGMSHFSLWEKVSLVYGMTRLAVRQVFATDDTEPTAAMWLRSRQPERVIQLFWQPVIESALGESIELVGITAVEKWLLTVFAHPQAADLLVPTQPLGELFGKKLVSWLEDQRVVVHTSRTATGIQYGESHDVTGVWCGEEVTPAEAVVLAVPWRAAARLVLKSYLPVDDSFVGSPITAVHLWFDRQIVICLAVLVGRVSQWVFRGGEEHVQKHEELSSEGKSEKAYHCQVVISASRGLCDGNREQLLETVVSELREIFPDAHAARLIRSPCCD